MTDTASILRSTCLELYPRDARLTVADVTSLESVDRVAAKRLRLLWDEGTEIAYAVINKEQNPNRLAKVKAILSDWNLKLGLRFIERDRPNQTTLVRISFDPNGGNTSRVGLEGLEVQKPQYTMNLACVEEKEEMTEMEKAMIMHQFAHALGMTHECSGGAGLKGDVMTQLYGEVHKWDAQRVKSDVLDVYNAPLVVTNFVTYHEKSLMRLPLSAQQTTTGVAIPHVDTISEHDMAWLTIHYPPWDPKRPEIIDHALTIVGVPKERRDQMSKTDIPLLRKQYAEWWAEQVVGEDVYGRALGRKTKDLDWFQRTCADLVDVVDGARRTGIDTVMKKADLLWSNHQEIKYSYLPGAHSGTTNQRRKVDDTIHEWTLYANITFKKVDKDGDIRIKFDPNLGSWSYVGRQCLQVPQDQATMNLAWIDKRTSKPDANEKGIILHEFGHALGLVHEHQSVAYGGKAALNEKATYDFYTQTQGWSRELVKERILDVYSSVHLSNLSKVDDKSIMKYFMPSELNNQNQALEPISTLSDSDKAFMVAHYPSAAPAAEAPEWNLGHALDIIGVEEPIRTTMIVQSGDADAIRRAFRSWSTVKYINTHPETQGGQTWGGHGNTGGPVITPSEEPTKPVHSIPSEGEVHSEEPTSEVPVRQPEAQPERHTRPIPSRTTTPHRSKIASKTKAKGKWCAFERHLGPAPGKLSSTRPNGPARAVAVMKKCLWMPGDTIFYWFEQEAYRLNPVDTKERPRAYRVKLVESVFAEYEKITNLHFKRAASEAEAFVMIWFRENNNESEGSLCLSGTDCKRRKANPSSKQKDEVGGTETTTCYLDIQVIQHDEGDWEEIQEAYDDALHTCRHEIGHMLGLFHEHESPLSPTYLPDNEEQDKRLTPDELLTWTMFDPESVMLYPGRVFKKTRKDGKVEEIETVQNLELSAKDKAFLQALYPSTTASLEVALLALGIKNPKPVVDAWDYAEKARMSEDSQEAKEQYTGVVEYMRDLFAEELKALNNAIIAKKSHTAKPLRDASSPAQPNYTSGSFINEIISKLQEVFAPGGGQIFTLQFPGRFLQMSQYAWDTKSAGVYGQVVKPLAVNESEFRLTDQLFDVDDVVGGPTGVSLSQVYEQVLNNLIPAPRVSKLTKHQQKIRGWLLKDVTASPWIEDLMRAQQGDQLSSSRAVSHPKKDSKVVKSSSTGAKPAFAISSKLGESSSTVNRMELSNALMQEYLDAKNAWEAERDDMLAQALKLKLGSDESKEALDKLTRTIAHTTAAREAQLAAKYNDAVVRGYSHNVKEYLGYLDVKSPSEVLQEAKDALREASMRSFDGSLRVYPVQMSPIDWFEGLSTSFTMEDLTSDPTLIEQEIKNKSQQLDALNNQLTALLFGTKGKVEELRAATQRAQGAVDNATAALAQRYTHNVLAMAKTCFDKAGKLDAKQLQDVGARLELASSVVTQLQLDLGALSTAQTALVQSSRAFTQASANLALAEATDTQQQQEQIRLQIRTITNDLSELTSRYTSLNKTGARPAAPTGEPGPVEDIPLFAERKGSSGGSRWQEIVMNHTVVSSYNSQSDSASAKSSGHQCNLWLFSSGHSSSSSSASSETRSMSSENNVTIGFRATLVTVDRAGWFRPQFFKQSSTFLHIEDEISWSRWPEGIKTMKELKGKKTTAFPVINQDLLPAYPVGYIIAKDITIKIRNSKTESSTSKSTMKEDSTSAGGVLCFSYNQSSSTSQSSNSHGYQHCSNGCVIRIPGPQILGYILQLTENDKSTSYEDAELPDPDEFLIPDDGTSSSKPQHDVRPTSALADQISMLLKQAHVPEDTLRSVRTALDRELNDLVGK